MRVGYAIALAACVSGCLLDRSGVDFAAEDAALGVIDAQTAGAIDAGTPDAAAPDASPPDAAPPDAALPACATNIFYQNMGDQGHSYRGSIFDVNWDTARATCEGEEAHLVVIEDDAENDILQGLFFDSPNVWIGLSDIVQEGVFVWVDGSPRTFDRFQTGEPNNQGDEDCVEMRISSNSDWNDENCGSLRNYICECDASAP